MTYQVLARKWRPGRFSEVVGQSHVVRTLKNAILLNRTAHAYLFVGPRGIGKTSIARIFAKALNCEHPEHGEPCCKCKQCISIFEGNNLDVIEIDAASNNSVNDIKPLRDAAFQMPANAKYKIYIIDEVHMLSQQAWNALLKLIEEPPSHVKFLFATTEVHKVLPTIISRCQRFDLHRIPLKLIVGQLEKIAEAEHVKINKLALEAIARVADGGMRDAQSVFDQIISCYAGAEETEITEKDIAGLFGLTGRTEIEKIVDSMLSDDKGEVVAGIHNLAEKGKDLEKLLFDILDFLRGIEICMLVNTPDNILEVGEDTIAIYKKFTSKIKIDIIQRMLEILSSSAVYLRDALNKQVFLEILLLKAMRFAHALKVEDVIQRLNQLRKSGELDKLADMPSIRDIPSHSYKNDTQERPQEPQKQNRSPVEKEIFTLSSEEEDEKKSDNLSPTATAGEALTSENTFTGKALQNTIPISKKFSPEALWHEVVVKIEHSKINPAIKSYLLEANPENIEDDKLTVAFDEEYDKAHFEEVKKYEHEINRILQEITGVKNFFADIIYKSDILSHHEETLIPDMNADLAEARRKIEQNPFVQKVCDIFDGTIIDIHA